MGVFLYRLPVHLLKFLFDGEEREQPPSRGRGPWARETVCKHGRVPIKGHSAVKLIILKEEGQALGKPTVRSAQI